MTGVFRSVRNHNGAETFRVKTIDQQTVKALLAPDTVALIGASGDASRLTARPQVFLDKRGYAGRVYPVNPGRSEVLGLPAFRSIAECPTPVEHACVLLDTDAAIQAVRECAAAGVRVVSVLADGFADAGEQGMARQAELTTIASDAGMLLIGPNSTGVVTTGSGFFCTGNAAFAADNLPAGRFAVLSQSGSMTGAIASRGAPLGLGFHSYVSVGNEAVTSVGELGEAMVSHPDIDGFVLFMETVRRPDAMARFARAAREANKPVLAYLVGQSAAGQALAVSHTGAMLGGRHALSAFLTAHGIQLVGNLEALIELSGAMALRHRVRGRPKNAAVVTTTGGGGAMVYDLLGLNGVALPPAADAVYESLAARGIHVKKGPLMDLTLAGTRYDTMHAVISALISEPSIGVVVAAIGSSAQFNPELSVRPIVDAVQAARPGSAPLVAVPVPHAPESLLLWQSGGVPACRTPDSCALVVAALLTLADTPDELPAGIGSVDLPVAGRQWLDAQQCQTDPTGQTGRTVTGSAAAELLTTLGIAQPQTVSWPAGQALPDVSGLSAPWVLKADIPGLAHKSEIGGVQTGIKTRDELLVAVRRMQQQVEDAERAYIVSRFELQEQVAGVGEVIVGLTRDAVVGPMVSIGMGGVLTEIYADIAMRPAPVSRGQALDMMKSVRGFAALRGFRGQPAADLNALADVVSRLSALASRPEVIEAELNPVIVRPDGDGAVAVDVLLHLAASNE